MEIYWVCNCAWACCGAVTIRSAKKKNLVPAAVVGKYVVAIFAMFFIESYDLS